MLQTRSPEMSNYTTVSNESPALLSTIDERVDKRRGLEPSSDL